jgi:hypothetical protein
METVKDIVTIFGTLAAVVIGFLGLKIWRIQQRSSADTELARRILVGLYKIKMWVSVIRHPFRQVVVSEEKRLHPNAVEEAYALQIGRKVKTNVFAFFRFRQCSICFADAFHLISK